MTRKQLKEFSRLIIEAINRGHVKKNDVVTAITGKHESDASFYKSWTLVFSVFNWARKNLTLKDDGCIIPYASGGRDSKLWVYEPPLTWSKLIRLIDGDVRMLKTNIQYSSKALYQLTMVIDEAISSGKINPLHLQAIMEVTSRLKVMIEIEKSTLKAVEDIRRAS